MSPLPPTPMDAPTPTDDSAPPAESYARSIVFLGVDRSPSFVTESARLPSHLAPGQVLVLVELATICGSDLHTLNGTRTTAHPCVLGHEGCGVVVRSQRVGVKPGDRVTWGICAACHTCLPCSLHLHNKCTSLIKLGHTVVSSATLYGTYSTHLLCLPNTPLVPLPPALTPTLAAPINCALATMVNAFSKLPPTPKAGQPGASVALVQGAGMLGLYCVSLLREAGYKRVFCVDHNRTRLAKATEFGAAILHPDSGGWSGREGAKGGRDLRAGRPGAPGLPDEPRRPRTHSKVPHYSRCAQLHTATPAGGGHLPLSTPPPVSLRLPYGPDLPPLRLQERS
nr:5-exo-hydroxycamphor dehydrogenase-like isoform X1 [Procambarus clarkii]